MSNKETVIDLIQRLPEDVSVRDILTALRDHYRQISPVNEEDWSTDELTEDEWRQFVAYGLRDELNDPREDIYTEDDGEASYV